MSGGSHNYLYQRVEQMAYDIVRAHRTPSPARRAFSDHLLIVAKAMEQVELVDSGDRMPGTDEKSIRAALPVDAELGAAIAMAEEASKALAHAIKQAKRDAKAARRPEARDGDRV